MPNPLMDALELGGYALDTPGAYLRGLLAGKPGERTSGEDLLGSYGVQGGPLGGFAAEMALDPLALAGLAGGAYRGIRGLTKAGVALSHADDANPLLRGIGNLVGDETGAMRPFMEIGRRTDPDYVNSVPWYHGSGTPGLTPDLLDPMKTDPEGLFGRGIYTTADPALAAVGPESYAHQRADAGLARWPGATTSAVTQWIRENPGRAGEADDAVLQALRGMAPGEAGLRGEYLREAIAQSDSGDPAGRFARLNLGRFGHHPGIGSRVEPLLRGLGVAVPPRPRPVLYEAGTNFGKILDLDLPADPRLVEQVRGMAEGAYGSSQDWLNELARAPGALNSDVFEGVKSVNMLGDPGTDPLIQALRQAGYDALSHTGGLRAGGGRNLHQVLIGLDPNDTISRVGRANQFPRFGEVDPQAILRLLSGGA